MSWEDEKVKPADIGSDFSKKMAQIREVVELPLCHWQLFKSMRQDGVMQSTRIYFNGIC